MDKNFDLKSPDQCVIVWSWIPSGRVTVEFWSVEDKHGLALEKQDSFVIEAHNIGEMENKWQFNQYNYKPKQSKFKVRINYEGIIL